MPLYLQDKTRTVRIPKEGKYVGTYCGNVFVVRNNYKKIFYKIIDFVPSNNTYRCKNGDLITRFLKNGEPISLLDEDEEVYLVLKRKIDGIDYLSCITKSEYLSLVK